MLILGRKYAPSNQKTKIFCVHLTFPVVKVIIDRTYPRRDSSAHQTRTYPDAMPHTRDRSKKLVGFWASPEEKERLQQIAEDHDVTLSELLRRLADGDLIVAPSGTPAKERKSKARTGY